MNGLASRTLVSVHRNAEHPTLEQYAVATGMPVEFLQTCEVSKFKQPQARIAYFLSSGRQRGVRYARRMRLNEPKQESDAVDLLAKRIFLKSLTRNCSSPS
jgi:hypothetical protein